MKSRQVLTKLLETTRVPIIHTQLDSDERPHGWWEEEFPGGDITNFLLSLPDVKRRQRQLYRDIKRALGPNAGQVQVRVGKHGDTSTGGGMASHSVDVDITGPEELLMQLYRDQNFAMEWVGDVLSNEELAEIQAGWNPEPVQIDPDPIRH